MFGTVVYGSVEMSINRVLAWEVRAVSTDDDAHYVYSHVRFTLELILNPLVNATQGTNFLTTATDGGGLGAGSDGGPQHAINVPLGFGGPTGVLAPTTFANLQHAMMQKRQPLRIYLGLNPAQGQPDTRVLFLESPELFLNKATNTNQGEASDAATGPNPISFRYATPIGLKTAVVHWTCETWINQCKAAHTVLSNQFRITEEIGEDYLSTLHVNGTAVMHMGRLLSAISTGSISADQFRQALFFPIPKGYQRTGVRVWPSSDGTTLNYYYRDEQQTYLLNPGKLIRKIRGRFGAGLQGAIDYDKAVKGTLKTIAGLSFGAAGLFFSDGPAQLVSSVKLPVRTIWFEVECWGTPDADPFYLMTTCVNIAIANNLDIINGNTIWDVEAHFPERYASLRAVTHANGIIGGIAALANGTIALYNLAGNNGELAAPNIAGGPLWQAGFRNSPAANSLPGIGPAREAFSGEYIELVAQALQKPCATPTLPSGAYGTGSPNNKNQVPRHVGGTGYGPADLTTVG